MAKETSNNRKDYGQFVGIAAVLGGVLLVMTILFLIFARYEMEYLVGMGWGLVLLGIFLGFFTLLSMKDNKK